jgi:hypothetical protein
MKISVCFNIGLGVPLGCMRVAAMIFRSFGSGASIGWLANFNI